MKLKTNDDVRKYLATWTECASEDAFNAAIVRTNWPRLDEDCIWSYAGRRWIRPIEYDVNAFDRGMNAKPDYVMFCENQPELLDFLQHYADDYEPFPEYEPGDEDFIPGCGCDDPDAGTIAFKRIGVVPDWLP